MPAPIRGRDVRDAIKEYGFEKGIIHVLERMCDERSGDRQTLREMAELLSTCVDQVSLMIEAGDAMGKKLKEIKRIEEQSIDGE